MSFRGLIFRHRLLLGLCLLSLLLHSMIISWVDLRFDWPAPQDAPAPLALRIAAPAPLPPARTELEARSVAAPVLAFTPQAIDSFAPVALQAPAAAAPEPDTSAPLAEPEPLGADVAVAVAVSDTEAALGETPGYYYSSPSPSVRVDYRLTRSAPGSAARDEGGARLEWESDGSSYTLALGGVLGDLRSQGGLDDAGVAPQRFLAPLGAGRATTLFDRRARVIASALGAWHAPLLSGSQDTASVLLQLGGIGMSSASQVRGTLRIWVAGPLGARLERYVVAGNETIESGLGRLETVRLERQLDADEPMLEVWLAPARSWLPVQLRLTTPDGTVLTQTASAIAYAVPAEN